MKIIALQAENVKRLRAVEIRPDGNLVQITGRNGQGKTSVLDSIWWALAGADHIQAAPIRQGEDRALIRLDMGEIVVERTFRRQSEAKGGGTTTEIKVMTAEGSKFPTPQRMLDGLLGALSFDPLAFTRMKQREQFDTLRRFVPGVDFEAIERADQQDYQRRTDVNRVARDRQTRADAISVPPDTPLEEVSEADLLAQIERAAKHNSEIQRRAENRANHARLVEDNRTRAQGLRDRAAALIAEAEQLEAEAQKSADLLAGPGAKPLPDKIDTAELTAKIGGLRAINEAVRRRQRRAELMAEAEEAEAESKALTAAMEQRRADKEAAIAAAELPVPGITFGDGEILLGGVPFAQASDAEQLRASILIAMAMEPKLRVLRVRDGSLLDEDAMALLAQVAEERDYQVWVERVDSSGQVGFVLEDGRVKDHAAQAAE